MPSQLLIRKMTETDLAFADSVRAAAGWNQTLEDWRRILRFEPDGCFLAEFDRRPAGTATTICYGDVLGWIGMILVHPEFRRRGIATSLMERSIEHLST
ncbi:MAG: GNAT family N-acetyltransferase, partial [Verrucomicrobiota bacterium]